MQMVFCGIGGQGILLATRIVGEYALSKGLNVIGSEVHGMSQRGGSVISHLKIGDYKSPLVMKGEADILLSFDWNEGIMNLPFLREDGIALINGDSMRGIEHPTILNLLRHRRIKLYVVDGYKIALGELKDARLLNMVLLGKLSSLKGDFFPYEEIRNTIEMLVPHEIRDKNLKAFDLGRNAEVREVI